MQKTKFQTFDALRFFAFFKVFLFHIPIVAFPIFNYLKDYGGIGVLFFFVLSGFLITYIILEEKEQTGRLDLKKFFLRRILRIWPLYFLMVVFSYLSPFIISALGLSSSSSGYEPELIYSITFTENYKMIAEDDHPNVSPLTVMWTLCVEEHFYIVWGVLLFFIRRKYLPMVILISVFTGMICRSLFFHEGWRTIDLLTNIDSFALGAIPAWMFITYREKFKSIIKKIPVVSKYLITVLTIAGVYIFPLGGDYFITVFMPLILGLLFAVIIAFIIPAQQGFMISEKNLFSRWGIWTYGLYLYHTIIINFFLQLFLQLNLNPDSLIIAILFIFITFAITVLVSKYSYIWFERPFLRLKKY